MLIKIINVHLIMTENSLNARKPTLDLLLELSENDCLTDKELRDEVLTLIVAVIFFVHYFNNLYNLI